MTLTAIGLTLVLTLWIAAATLERPPVRPCNEAVRVPAAEVVER